MKYALLIYENGDEARGRTEADIEPLLEGHRALQADSKAAGKFLAADQLKMPDHAKTLRVRGGKVLVTDGPFIESKEHLIGFYLVDCETMDEAIAYAAMIPHADPGAIEVRPVAYHESLAAQD